MSPAATGSRPARRCRRCSSTTTRRSRWREDWRTFRADRIRPHLPAGPRFTPREPPEDVAAHVVRGTASTGWAYPARVHLHASAEVIAQHDRVTPAAGLLTPVDEHSCVLETGSASLRDLVGYLTGLDVGFEVLDPPELRTLLRELAERYLAAAPHDDIPARLPPLT